MTNKHGIIVTTSNTIEGASILSYAGIITSHVVAGTGIFSDILGSFSDFFGGRSGSYQKQIESVKSEAIETLKQKALALNCNAIISVHLDVDEISGKNVSMFMITAYGTAVVIENHLPNVHNKADSFISGVDVSHSIRRRSIAEKYSSDPLLIHTSDVEWKSILQLSVPELIPYIIKYFRTQAAYEGSERKTRLTDYVKSLETEQGEYLMYSLVSDSNGMQKNYRIFAKVIVECEMLNYIKVEQILDSELLEMRKAALIILMSQKQAYYESDLEDVSRLIDKVNNVFTDESMSYTKKGLVGGEKILWKCLHGHDGNQIESSTCKTCQCDKYGFDTDEVKPEEVQAYLAEVKKSVEMFFQGAGDINPSNQY